MSVRASGTSALAVAPFRVLRAHSPFGSETVPGRISAVTLTWHCTSPRSLKTRTASPSVIARAAESSGCILMRATAGRSSPKVDEMVCVLAGEIRLSG